MACVSEPPSLITSPATARRYPTYGMSPPLRTWLWCFSSAYTSAFENWPVSFGVEVCSLIFDLSSFSSTITAEGGIEICPRMRDNGGSSDKIAASVCVCLVYGTHKHRHR